MTEEYRKAVKELISQSFNKGFFLGVGMALTLSIVNIYDTLGYIPLEVVFYVLSMVFWWITFEALKVVIIKINPVKGFSSLYGQFKKTPKGQWLALRCYFSLLRTSIKVSSKIEITEKRD